MMGRVKVGDYIICDGTRGKVSSISYTSTMLEATDGSVIAFQNSQLFSKNYKNMTKNHGYELDILEVGIAYGSNVKEVKQILIDALIKLDCIYQDKGVKVLLKSFDDSCITLRDCGMGQRAYPSHRRCHHHGVHLRYAQRSQHRDSVPTA